VASYVCCIIIPFRDRLRDPLCGDDLPRVSGFVGSHKPVGHGGIMSICSWGHTLPGVRVCNLRHAVGSSGLW
jgi:hypothetical protein